MGMDSRFPQREKNEESRKPGHNPEQQTEVEGIPGKHGVIEVKGTECLRKEGVISSTKCCQEIIEINTDNVY